jgi:hypothetical protein
VTRYVVDPPRSLKGWWRVRVEREVDGVTYGGESICLAQTKAKATLVARALNALDVAKFDGSKIPGEILEDDP